MNEMYERIEALCKRKNVNVTQMCKEAGVSRGNMTDLKMGRTAELSTKTLAKLSVYFGVSIDYLLGTEKAPSDNGEGELPHEQFREVLAGHGIRLLLDADSKVTKEQLEDIVDFINFQQRKNGR